MSSSDRTRPPRKEQHRVTGHKYVTWSTYSREQLGRLLEFCLSNWRGVLLSVTPSGELLTVRIYDDTGNFHVFGRTLQECEARLRKKAAVDWEAQHFYSPQRIRNHRADSGDNDDVLVDAPVRAFKSMAEFEDEIRREREKRLEELRIELRERFPRYFRER